MPYFCAQNACCKEPVWHQSTCVFQLHSPKILQPWLLDTGSLTQRLISESGNQFSVSVVKQELDKPRHSEARILSLSDRRVALVREVVLQGNNNDWVFARTVIPLSTLTGRLKALRHLDNRPLGALLFADPNMQRGPMEVTRLTRDHALPSQQLKDNQLPAWGRRSIFYLDGKPLLVNEFFLTGFVQHLKQQKGSQND